MNINLNNSKVAVCMDPFNANLKDDYLTKVFEDQKLIVNDRTAFWLDRNVPIITNSTNIPIDSN